MPSIHYQFSLKDGTMVRLDKDGTIHLITDKVIKPIDFSNKINATQVAEVLTGLAQFKGEL